MLPWQDTTALDQREAFIAAWRKGEETVTSLAHNFGISRKTAHKFINRFVEAGHDGLLDRSRAPHSVHNATPQDVVDLLIQAKREDPAFGPKKLLPLLQATYPHLHWPAPSTAGAILDRVGLVHRRRTRRRTPSWQEPFRQATQPNDCWCTDFKGWVRTGNGVRIDPLTIQDASSRYMLTCQILLHPTFHQVRPVFERTFREFGLPRVIRSDNGTPFASTALGGLSQLAVWFVKLGIIPERIQPGHPEQNGRLERFHRTLDEEALNPIQATPRRQQLTVNSFLYRYNHVRPHEALGQTPPADHYHPSPRSYPRKVKSPVYDANVTVRRVRTNGEIKWNGARIYMSEALIGEPVGLVQRDDRYWAVRFGPLEIGLLDARERSILRIPPTVLPMCPV